MNIFITATCNSTILRIPIRLNLIAIGYCSRRSHIALRRSPSECDVNILVNACTNFSCIADDSFSRSIVLEYLVSVVVLNLPVQNLSFSCSIVSFCLRNSTNFGYNGCSIYCRISVLSCIVYAAIQFKVIVEFFFRNTLCFKLSNDLLFYLMPCQVKWFNGFRTINSVNIIKVEVNIQDNFTFTCSRSRYNLEFSVTYSNDIITDSIGQGNTYQWFAADFCAVLFSTICLLFTVLGHLRSKGTTIFTADLCMRTFRSFVITYMITNQFIAIFKATVFSFTITGIFIQFFMHVGTITLYLVKMCIEHFRQIYAFTIPCNFHKRLRSIDGSLGCCMQMIIFRFIRLCLCQYNIMRIYSFNSSIVRCDNRITFCICIMSLQCHYSYLAVFFNIFDGSVCQVRFNGQNAIITFPIVHISCHYTVSSCVILVISDISQIRDFLPVYVRRIHVVISNQIRSNGCFTAYSRFIICKITIGINALCGQLMIVE